LIFIEKGKGDISVEEYCDNIFLRSYEYKYYPPVKPAKPLNNYSDRSTEAADHGTFTQPIPKEHSLYYIVDKSPDISIPEEVKKISSKKSFQDEAKLYKFVNDNIASLLKGTPKRFHREIPLSATEGVNVGHIHVCEVNQNDRICYTVYFSEIYNKIVILVTCYFSHNTGVKSSGHSEMKNNPSKSEFNKMQDYKKTYYGLINQQYPNGGWKNA
jgi:hypothetical protein